MIWALLVALALLGAQNAEEIVTYARTKMASWTAFDSLFKTHGAKYSVDWRWLKAIALNESNLGEEASVKVGLKNPADIEGSKSSDGKSWGLMQVTLTTARDFDSSATPEKLNDPEYSVRIAAQYLNYLQRIFPLIEVRWQEWVIKSYNQGQGNTKKERAGAKGYADAYWERFKRNLKKVEEA